MNIFVKKFIEHVTKREPDIYIGGKDNPYLIRWHVIPRNRFFNIYLHHFMRSDDDRALHTHPWINMSILLDNEYVEHLHDTIVRRTAGSIVFRKSGNIAHRIELTCGPCWTLFLTGPRYQQWGFLCPQGFVHWRDFTSGDDGSTVGKGCGE